ncbi:membrane transporter [Fomitiporia mediterranea MF3/22]|uniref:membrane transporter n=1 Tax=Fomitiporia mediterranea (strain MF3/22) TaxID=694068 RepID=UPI0004407AD2|nr:membrane transporter [Fomitiporia mediterranea MF3/22]EJD04816.1 membrane transporter [Fomitiporia mediterranea MF3/22]
MRSSTKTSSLSDKEAFDDDKHHHATADVSEVDENAQFSIQDAIDPEEAARVRRKVDRHILPLMCVVYWVTYMDKTTLGSSAVLGLKTSTHLNATQYNWLSTIFYLSYLVFQYPQNLALQRFPVGKWLSANIFIWGVILCLHAACKNFGGLFAVRLIKDFILKIDVQLGACEACLTPGFMIVSAMFYTRREITLRIGCWYLMIGIADITIGFLAFGALHIKTLTFEPWKWLMIMCGIITIVIAVCYWLFFPDSPATAWFLTPEERVIAVNRIKANQAGIENKHFKKEQMIECLVDPKTWIFALHAGIRNIPNSLSNQNSLIIKSFGFTELQTTLLSCVTGGIKIASALSGVALATYFNSIAYVGASYYIPSVIGSILVSTLPWSNKVGLLISEYIVGVCGVGTPLGYSWVMQTTAGHTKRITMNAVIFIIDSVGNSIGPQMWADQFAPRYHVPWAVISICYTTAALLLLLQRYMLNKENKRRDREPPDDTYDDVWVKITDEGGEIIEKKVDRAFLDLTDRQNREFRYVL